MTSATALAALALATAVGLGPYPALVAVGLAAHAGWLGLPPALSGLAAPTVWGTLIGLWAIEIWASRHPLSDFLWNAFHTIVRPLSAALAAGSMVGSGAPALQWLAALAGLAVGFVIHMQRFGLHVIFRRPGGRGRRAALAGVAAALGVGLALLALGDPPLAASLAALLLILPLPWAPPLWRATVRAVRRTWPDRPRPDAER